jgi:hypothetical protein
MLSGSAYKSGGGGDKCECQDDDDDDDDINLRPGNLSSNLPKGIWTC